MTSSFFHPGILGAAFWGIGQEEEGKSSRKKQADSFLYAISRRNCIETDCSKRVECKAPAVLSREAYCLVRRAARDKGNAADALFQQRANTTPQNELFKKG